MQKFDLKFFNKIIMHQNLLNINKILYILFLFFLFIFITGSFFLKAEFCMVTYGDKPMFLKQNLKIFIPLLIFLFILYKFCYFQIQKLNKYKPIYVMPPIFFASILLQLLVIYFFRINLTADWEVFYGFANQFLKGNFSGIQKGNYLYTYPYNIGITLYMAFFSKIFPNNIYVLRFLNVIFTTINAYIIYLLYKELYQDNKNHYEVLIFTSFFLPTIFLNNLVYNDIISCHLFLLGTFFLIKYVKYEKPFYIFSSAIFFGIGNFFRYIGFIFVTAAIIYMILKSIKFKKIILFSILFCFFLFIPFKIISLVLERNGIISEPLGANSAPFIKWVNMGITEDRYGYWDEGVSYHIYLDDAKSNKTLSEKIFVEKIKEKISKMGFAGLTKMYYKKLLWMWTEGTYQSVYYGMSHPSPGGYKEETVVSKFFVEHFEYRTLIKWVMYTTNFLMYVIIFFGLIERLKDKDYKFEESIFILIFLGFISFYLLWEIKPRYIYQTYPYLLILFFMSLRNLHFNQMFSNLFIFKSIFSRKQPS